DTSICSEIARVNSRAHRPIEIAGTFPDFSAVAQHLSQNGADALLIDASPPNETSLIRKIKALPLQQIPTTIVILQRPTVSMVLQLVSAGVRSILYKNDDLEAQLIQAIFGKKR